MGRGLRNKFLSIDILGEPIGFNIDGKETYRTCLGSVLVLLIAVVTLVFSTIRFGVLVDLGDTNYQSSLENFEGDDIFENISNNFGDFVFFLTVFDAYGRPPPVNVSDVVVPILHVYDTDET